MAAPGQINICEKSLRVVELYSGIGGMHYALQDSGISYEVVAAVDINTVANAVYAHNFPSVPLISACILGMSAEDFDNFDADMILMSPPCQPFTSVGKQRDVDDVRTKSFLHILDLLPVLRNIPEYVLVENVRGFDCSAARQRLVDVLTGLQFTIQEYLLSPVQFGTPNSRMRYYMLARRRCQTVECHTTDNLLSVAENLETVCDQSVANQYFYNKDWNETKVVTSRDSVDKFSSIPPFSLSSSSTSLKLESLMSTEVKPLSEYLELGCDNSYAVPPKFYRQFWVMDLVRNHSLMSCCFTKRYGHYIEGAGSVLQRQDSGNDLMLYKGNETSPEFIEGIHTLGLRFFSPREIANLLGFPSHFKLPESLTTKQCYRVLGNSLNVKVVSILLQLLTNNEDT